MRLTFYLTAILSLSACGSSPPDDAARGETNSVTVELPPATPFKAPEEVVTPETNLASNETQADVSNEAEATNEDVAAKPDAPEVTKEADQGPSPTEAPPKAKVEAATGEVRLLPARVPLPDAEIVRTIERIGFSCGTVVSSNRVDNPGGDPVYKIDCSSGSSYQGTNKSGRFFFREWTGKLTRD